LAGKGAPGSARSAILNFLAAAEAEDLAPLLHLFIQPLSHCLKPPGSAAATITADGYPSLPPFPRRKKARRSILKFKKMNQITLLKTISVWLMGTPHPPPFSRKKRGRLFIVKFKSWTSYPI
jgi:hypothetical protein